MDPAEPVSSNHHHTNNTNNHTNNNNNHHTDSTDHNTDRVTATSYGALDCTLVTDDCWMIRIPPKLAGVWDKAPEGTELGELVFCKGGRTTTAAAAANHKNNHNKHGAGAATGVGVVKPKLTVHLSDALVSDAATTTSASKKHTPTPLPQNYSLQAMTKKIPALHPFTRNPKNGSCVLLGTVARTANLQVDQEQQSYRNQLKDRLVQTNLHNPRFVKPFEATGSVLQKQQQQRSRGNTGAAASGFGDSIARQGQRRLDAVQHEAVQSSLLHHHHHHNSGGRLPKRARLFAPDAPLRSVLFALFAQQPYWTIKDLKAAMMAGGWQPLNSTTNGSSSGSGGSGGGTAGGDTGTDGAAADGVAANHGSTGSSTASTSAANSKRAEAEIRDMLRNEIGEYHRSGDHKNQWELRREFQQTSQESPGGTDGGGGGGGADHEGGATAEE